jgi:hypothetical protein
MIERHLNDLAHHAEQLRQHADRGNELRAAHQRTGAQQQEAALQLQRETTAAVEQLAMELRASRIGDTVHTVALMAASLAAAQSARGEPTSFTHPVYGAVAAEDYAADAWALLAAVRTQAPSGKQLAATHFPEETPTP